MKYSYIFSAFVLEIILSYSLFTMLVLRYTDIYLIKSYMLCILLSPWQLIPVLWKKLGLACLVFPGGSDHKESACNTRDSGLIPGSRSSPGEGNGYLLQYSCLENSMDRRDWQATVWPCFYSYSCWQYVIKVHFWNTLYLKGFPGGSDSKESACKAGDLSWIPGLGRSPGEGNANPL